MLKNWKSRGSLTASKPATYIYGECAGGISDGPERDAKLDWVICGGESGPGARPMHPDWARSLRDQCVAAGVPFFFKQWESRVPWQADGGFSEWKSQSGKLMAILESASRFQRQRREG